MDNQIYAANVPQEDEDVQDTPNQDTPNQQRQKASQAVPCYADAMCEIDKELHAMRDANTKDELKAAALKVKELLEKYAPRWPYICERKSHDARYYISKFKERAA